MSSAPTFETEIYWSEPANQVIVTGAFDNWARSVQMEKTGKGWIAKVQVPYGSKVDFKYIVDGQWQVNHHFPTTFDKQGNLNNYIVTPAAPAAPAPEPTPAPVVEPAAVSERAPTPEPIADKAAETFAAAEPGLKVATEEKPAVSEPEPVTPVNLPNSVEPAVTPMVVPPSSISAHEGLSDVDPAVSRQIIEAVLEAEKEGGKEVEIAGAHEDTLIVRVDETVKDSKEAVDMVVFLQGEPIVASPPVITPDVEAPTPPAEADLATPKDAPKTLTDGFPGATAAVGPLVDTSAAAVGAVELNSPIAKPVTPPPTTTPSALQTPAAVPLPQTPAAVDATSTPKAEESSTPPSAWSTGSTTSTPTKAERPGALGGSIKKSNGSTKGSRIFSFPGRRSSQDGAGSAPSSPGSTVRQESSESVRRKKNSFMAKVHDIFHPHHKQQPSQ